MKKYTYIAIALALTGCAGNDQTSPTEPKSPTREERMVLPLIEQKIGEATVRMIREADKAEVVPITITSADKGNKEAIGEFFIDGEGRELAIDELELWKSLLLDDKSYIFDRQKRCAFLPQFAILFHTNNNELPILISTSCRQAQFVRKGASVLIDIDPIADEIQNLADTISVTEEQSNG